MDEKKLLETLAKALGTENVLTEIEARKEKEKKMLDSMAKSMGVVHVLEEVNHEEELLKEKKKKEKELLDKLNETFTNFTKDNEEHIELIEQEIQEIIPQIEPEVIIETAGRQPEPELPKKDIINRSVELLSKPNQQDGDIQKVADKLPPGVQKELDIIKKSIADFHRFAQRHSQMGGGGEVRLARLDDVNASTISDGLYLRYDASTKMFVFDDPIGSEPGEVQSDWNEANTYAIDYIKNKPLIVMDANGNISAAANFVSNNNFSLGTYLQPWANVFVGPSSLTVTPNSPNGTPIILQNNNDILAVTGGGFAVYDPTDTFYSMQVDATVGQTLLHAPNPVAGSSVLSVSANPSSNSYPLAYASIGGVGHFTGPVSGPTNFVLDNFDNSGVFGLSSALTFRRFHGTPDSPTAVLSGDQIGIVAGVGYNGNNVNAAESVNMRFVATENWTTSNLGSKIEFWTIPTGTATFTETVDIVGDAGQPGLKFIQSNSGITFTDGSFQNTAAAAQSITFWTPTLTFSTPPSGHPHLTTQDLTGWAIKKGQLVTAFFTINQMNLIGTGTVSLSGLPFLSANWLESTGAAANNVGSLTVTGHNLANVGIITGTLAANSTTIPLYGTFGSTFRQVQQTDWDGVSPYTLIGSVTYISNT
jgi:hypothetical protein